MKALAVFPAQRALRVIEVEDPPAPGAGEVRVRTLELGICGTDKEIASFQYGTPPVGAEFLIIGHECLGEVTEVGAGVERFRRGDLVVPRVRRPCRDERCTPCRLDRSDYCVTGDYTERGIVGAHGFGCEAWIEREEYLHPVPRSLRSVGVLTEPLTIAEKALDTFRTVQARLPGPAEERTDEVALVLGAGPVGLLGTMAMLTAGFRTHVYSRKKKPHARAAAAESFGAPYLASEELTPEQVCQRVGRVGFVYEATGASQLAFDVLRQLGPNGVFVFTGVPGRKQPFIVEGGTLMKQLVLQNQVALGTVNAGPEDFASAVRDLERFEFRWPGGLARLVTDRLTPEEGAEVLREGASGGIKSVIVFGRSG